MRRELAALLDAGADSRKVLKHLAALEIHLGQGDALALDGLSLSTLQTMLRQLYGLMRPPASAGIEMLLSGLLDAIEVQTRLQQRQSSHEQAISSFFVDHKMEIRELSDSAFEEASRCDTARVSRVG